MIDQSLISAIRQEKLNCLAAKHLHVRYLGRLRKWNRRVDFLAIAVPALFFPVRFLAKGTFLETYVEVFWELLAAVLLICVVLKIVYRWQERSEEHGKLLGENISLAGQADNLLANASEISPANARSYLVLTEKIKTWDTESLGELAEADKQFAYREGLKEWEPGNATIACPGCNASPWHFIPGSCQMCGNSPKR
jgi:mobilome CxxCx(11)CxxC protein